MPPNKAVVAHKPEEEWLDMGPRHAFQFSLYPNSLVAVTKRDGEVIQGYFRKLDRAGAQIDIANVTSKQQVRSGIGSKRLSSFRKLFVDRLGRVSDVPGEVRTWHGAACT
jgi:CRISPR-associated endonuclease Csn1